jgi:uncharacterized protein YuzE
MDNPMTVTIGNLTFDHATYDDHGDVLYLHIGEHQAAADSEETPEGHVLRFNDRGEVIGVTIINAKWLLQRDQAINITVPSASSSARRALRGTDRRLNSTQHRS